MSNAVLLFPVIGTLIRRQRVPLPAPNDDQFYHIYHFNINQQMVLYSRVFTVTNCDSFTQNFLSKLGVRLNNPVGVPDDPYSKHREEVGLGFFICFKRFIQNNNDKIHYCMEGSYLCVCTSYYWD